MDKITEEQIKAATQIHDDWLENWKLADDALDTLKERCPSNKDETDVIIKVITLNQLYFTRLQYAIHNAIPEMTHNIVRVFRNPVSPDKINLVGQIANLSPQAKPRVSFASKYCHFFVDEEIPIYDKYALRAVRLHLEEGELKSKDDTPSYANYCSDLTTLRKKSNLDCSTRQLDRYLWLAGLWQRYHDDGKTDFNREVCDFFVLHEVKSSVDKLVKTAFPS